MAQVSWSWTAGIPQNTQPRRINGPLKKVWRPLQEEPQQLWITKKKPSLGRPAEEVASVQE